MLNMCICANFEGVYFVVVFFFFIPLLFLFCLFACRLNTAFTVKEKSAANVVTSFWHASAPRTSRKYILFLYLNVVYYNCESTIRVFIKSKNSALCTVRTKTCFSKAIFIGILCSNFYRFICSTVLRIHTSLIEPRVQNNIIAITFLL